MQQLRTCAALLEEKPNDQTLLEGVMVTDTLCSSQAAGSASLLPVAPTHNAMLVSYGSQASAPVAQPQRQNAVVGRGPPVHCPLVGP